MPPIRDVITTYKSIGRIKGKVILVKTCHEVAPSTSAASLREPSIPSIPASKSSVVFPNHMVQFMKATRALVDQVLEKNMKGLSRIPISIRRLFTGPLFAKKEKNSDAKDVAIIRFGKYMTVLKN
jgi:hypothetical protein